MKDNIHIYFKIDSNRWKRTILSRTAIISNLIHSYDHNVTLWHDDPKKRMKMLGMLPSGELVNEMSISFLSNQDFNTFVKKLDSTKTISYYTEKGIEKDMREVYKLVPIVQDDSEDSFGIKLEGEETKFFTYCNYINDKCPSPINFDNVSKNEEGMYIGEMAYFYKDINPLLERLKERLIMLLSYVKDFDNKTQDQKHLETILPKIIEKLELMLEGKNVSESLRMYLSLVKINLNSKDNSIIDEIEEFIKKNKARRYLHGYGTWYKLEDENLNSSNYGVLDYSPYRKEISGMWEHNTLKGPVTILKSSHIQHSNDKIYFKVSYVENNQELIKFSFHSILIKDQLKIGIKDIKNKKDNIYFKSITVKKDSNRHVIESMTKQECLRYLIETYINYPEKLLKDCITFLANTTILSTIDFIHYTEVPDESNMEIYKALLCDPFIQSLFLKNISSKQYYIEIINKLTSSINSSNYQIVRNLINQLDVDIRNTFKDPQYGDTLLHLAILMTSIDRDFSLSWIKELVNEFSFDINSVENSNRTILHSLIYNHIETFSNVEYEEDKENIEYMLENILNLEDIEINLTDDNELTILHLLLMTKYDNILKLLDMILEKDPDLSIKSLYPVEATPLQIAILYKQDEAVIQKLKDKMSLEDFSSQINVDIISHVKDIFNTNVSLKEEENNKIKVVYVKEEKKEDIKEDENKDLEDKVEKKEDVKEDKEEKKPNEIERVRTATSYNDIIDVVSSITDENINTTDGDDNTIGHAILQNEFVQSTFDSDEIIKIFYKLWEKGYNINALNSANDSPFLLLFTEGYKRENNKDLFNIAKKFLEDFEADPDNTNDAGVSALYKAVEMEDEVIVMLLLDYDSGISNEVIELTKRIKNEKIKKMI